MVVNGTLVNGEWLIGEGVRATSNEQSATKDSDRRNCPEVFLDLIYDLC